MVYLSFFGSILYPPTFPTHCPIVALRWEYQTLSQSSARNRAVFISGVSRGPVLVYARYALRNIAGVGLLGRLPESKKDLWLGFRQIGAGKYVTGQTARFYICSRFFRRGNGCSPGAMGKEINYSRKPPPQSHVTRSQRASRRDLNPKATTKLTH